MENSLFVQSNPKVLKEKSKVEANQQRAETRSTSSTIIDDDEEDSVYIVEEDDDDSESDENEENDEDEDEPKLSDTKALVAWTKQFTPIPGCC